MVGTLEPYLIPDRRRIGYNGDRMKVYEIMSRGKPTGNIYKHEMAAKKEIAANNARHIRKQMIIVNQLSGGSKRGKNHHAFTMAVEEATTPLYTLRVIRVIENWA